MSPRSDPAWHLSVLDRPVPMLLAVTGRVEVAAGSRRDDALLGAVTRLVQDLLEAAPGRAEEPPVRALDLPVPVLDYLLVQLHRREFGPVVALRRPCRRCQAPAEASFPLDDLEAARQPRLDGAELVRPGVFRCDGSVLRVPTARDLLESPDEVSLMERLVEGQLEPDSVAVVDAWLARLCPRMAADVAVECAECGLVDTWELALDEHLLLVLERERPLLWREVDLLARWYGWGLDPILGLARSDRHHLVALAATGSFS